MDLQENDHDFVLEVLKHHPQAVEKMTAMVRFVRVTEFHFIVRMWCVDGHLRRDAPRLQKSFFFCSKSARFVFDQKI